ncbi:AAA family ATPase [Kitasatospora sp. MAP5-34]|uniref:ATP-binding protein n=1 Tax=Kitasatospora sp. MAP5-34 TaxID=3035102 RepID=UPI0024735B91|nr:AAA family ATPase [Kitasatospora sp. MAP5-34]MDH6579730.1 tetratricopeptide (TPR) repeat protein [Kitasatospora sp. MAP5-34]
MAEQRSELQGEGEYGQDDTARATPLHEREDELRSGEQSLTKLCREFAAGGTEIGELLLFAAPPGHGKTSVLDQIRRLAKLREPCTVLSGRGGERQIKEPFHVLRQLLLPVLGALTETERGEVFGNWYGIVGPAIGLVPPSGEMEPLDPQGVRDGLDYVLFQLAPRRAPLVMVVDDLHWADQESLTWLASFAVRARHLPVLLVFAYRDGEFAEEARSFQQQIESQAARKHVLRPLNPDSVAELVRAELGAADDQFCRQVWAITGGSPYDTEALLREIREQALEPTEENSPQLHDLAASAKGMTHQYWLEKLGPNTLRFAWAAALLGTDIKHSLAANICAQGPAEAAESVRQLRRHRVLKDSPYGQLDFVHTLIGTSIYQSIPPATRTGMHGIAAMAIENTGGTLLEASRHLLETHPDGDDEIVRKLRKAAVEHLAIGAPDAAYRCLERALIEPPDEDDRAEVLYEAGCAALLTDPAATVNQLRLALELEDGLDPERRIDAITRLAEVLAHSGELFAAAETCRIEADRTPPGLGQLRLRAAQFMWTAWQREEEDGPGRSRALKELYASLTGKESAERAVLAMRAWDLTLRGEPVCRILGLVEEALVDGRLPQELGWRNAMWGFELPAIIGLSYTYTDQLARAEKLFSDAILEFDIAGWSGAHLGFAYFLMGLVRFRRGFLAEAEDFLRRGLRLSERIAPDIPLQWDIVGVLADTLLARGRVDEAWELCKTYRFAPPFHPTAMVLPDAPTLYGKLLLARGDHEGAVTVLREVGRQLDDRGWHNPVWAPWVGHLALALAPDQPDEARKVAADAVARARVFGSASAIGTALRQEAAVWDGPRTVELLEEAVGSLTQSPAGYELAQALVDLGSALRRAGRSADAAEHLYQGMELAQHCGADSLVARTRRELSTSGLRPNRLRTVSRDALSQPEWAVAELAVQGVPPQRIAERLDLELSLVHRRLAAVHRKAGTGPEGLAAALGLTDAPEPDAPEPDGESDDGSDDGA